MNIHNLFPLPIGFFRLGRDLTKTELDFIMGMERYPNQGNTTSSDRKVLRHKELTDIRDFIEDAMLEYFKTVHDPKGDVALYVTQSWANYTEPGQYHHKHAHPNSFISGVFYPQADRSVDKIYFYKSGYERIGMAVSRDMLNWRRYGIEPVVDNGKGISGDPQICRMGDLWVMFYFGAFWQPNAFDTFACSYDLVTWTKWRGAHLIEPTEEWDRKYAHKPWLIFHNNVVYHFYCAVGDQGRIIALATSEKLR